MQLFTFAVFVFCSARVLLASAQNGMLLSRRLCSVRGNTFSRALNTFFLSIRNAGKANETVFRLHFFV